MTKENNGYNYITNLIPHRYPFLLIDRIVEIIENEKIKAIKNITSNEPQFNGHFPGAPVFPGVMIVESLAQAAGVMLSSKMDDNNKKGKLVYLTSIEQAKFRKIVIPGDVLMLEVNVIQSRSIMWRFEGIASVDGETVAEASFSAMLKDRE